IVGLAALVVLAGMFLPVLKQPLPPRRQKEPRSTFWYRYSRFVQHHSWASAIGGLAVLVLLALPVFGLRLGFSDEGNAAPGTDTREAYDLLAEGFGPGFNGPLLLVSEVPAGVDAESLAPITDALPAHHGVAFPAGPQP